MNITKRWLHINGYAEHVNWAEYVSTQSVVIDLQYLKIDLNIDLQ